MDRKSSPTSKEVDGQGPLPYKINQGASVFGKGLQPRRLKNGSPEHVLWQEARDPGNKGDCKSGDSGGSEATMGIRKRNRKYSPENETGRKVTISRGGMDT